MGRTSARLPSRIFCECASTKTERQAEGGDMKSNKMTGKFGFIAALATVLAWAASAPAQTVVVGTGNPDLDVPAVQAAVDQGGDVVLKGHFSFNRPPAVPTFDGDLATVLVSKAVTISGAQYGDREMTGDDHGEMTTIEGGMLPFYVEASGARVTIQRLRFVRPKGNAILVYAIRGLVIASNKIERVEPGSSGIFINTSVGIPTPDQPGHPENVSGTLLVVNNHIDLAGGTHQDTTIGLLICRVGVPGAEVEAYVSGNTIRNFTERAISLRRVVGRAYIEGNVITTGTVAGGANGTQTIFVAGLGPYLIAHNSVDAQWETGSAAGITVRSGRWPNIGSIVVDNDVNMDAPEGTIFDANCDAIVAEGCAGIEIRGDTQGTVVLNNRIRGRARAALAVAITGGEAPRNNTFVLNRLDDFKASLADVFVGDGVMNTLIAGQQSTVEDHGVGTVIVPVAGKGEGKDKDDR